MNKRIQELARQSGAYHKDDDGEETKIAVLIGKEVEKFAELIIKETLQVARAGIEFGDGMEDAVYKYFGVEE